MDGAEKKIGQFRQKYPQFAQTIPMSADLSVLKEEWTAGGICSHNRIVFQPMEGCDGTADGAPGELTQRRYRRFAQAGAGIIWLEAVAVTQRGRANPRQLMLTPSNLPQFRALVQEIRQVCLQENGFQPLVILQATHSGRYSKPEGVPAPLVACHNPLFEGTSPLPEECILSDEECAALPAMYAETARLARECGFDGIDVKCCHRYLLSEFLSAYGREGRYGGSFENRTRLYFDCIRAVKAYENERFFVTTRLNVYDGFAYPYGFGVREGNGTEPDLSEAEKVISALREEFGIRLVNITVGNPYVNPHVNRPFYAGPYKNPEHPFVGAERIAAITSALQKRFPDMGLILSGTSCLRDLSPYYGAGMVAEGGCAFVGFGRMTFAYPQFVRDLFAYGTIDKNKCCAACSRCSAMMRSGKVAGCPVFDKEVYAPIEKGEEQKG